MNNKALFLTYNNPSYLQLFDPKWLSTLQLSTASGSPKDFHVIPAIANHSYDYLFIASEIIVQANIYSFANWLRILKPNGRVFLQKNDQTQIQLELGIAAVQPVLANVNYAWQHSVELTKAHNIPNASSLITHALHVESAQQWGYAATLYQQAVIINPNDFHAWYYLSNFYQQRGWIQQDIALWDIINTQFSTTQAQLGQVLARLLVGDYANGFYLRELYANRYMPKHRRCHAFPTVPDKFDHKRWQKNQSLVNKRFVVWSEFGLGDELMFAELAYVFKHILKVGELIWVVQPALVSLLKTCPYIDKVVSAAHAHEEITDLDYWEFPYALLAHTNSPFEQIPRMIPYVSANEEKMNAFAPKLHSDKKYKIGLAWRGSAGVEHDHIRSIHNVSLLNILLQTPNVEFFCLHKDLNPAELQWLKDNQIRYFSDELHDFSDTAAIMAQMDCVVSTDTSIVHVAGALNIPAYVMLALPAYDWRWGLPNEHVSAWYPSVQTVFPPTPIATWSDTLSRMRDILTARFQ